MLSPGNYIQDFVLKQRQQVKMRDNRVITQVSAAQCATLCVQEGSFTCNSFDYCGNMTECRLSDAMVSNVGQVTLEPTAYCDVYLREYDSCDGDRIPTTTTTITTTTATTTTTIPTTRST